MVKLGRPGEPMLVVLRGWIPPARPEVSRAFLMASLNRFQIKSRLGLRG